MNIEVYEKLEEILTEIDDNLVKFQENGPLEETRESLSEVLYENREVKFKLTFYSPTFLAYMEPGTLPCPICGNPPDSCTDHKHYLCRICGEDLEFQTTNDVWMCEYCDSCEHCGAPPDENFCPHCKNDTSTEAT